MTLILLAPNPSQSFETTSGRQYTSDSNGLISGILAQVDYFDLIAFGCSPILGTRNILFALPGICAAGADLANWVVMTRPGFFSKAYIAAKTAPVGSSLICDILKSSNGGVSFSSIWSLNPSNRIQLASGSATGTQTAFDMIRFVEGDILRIDVAGVGSSAPGSNVSVTLRTFTQ